MRVACSSYLLLYAGVVVNACLVRGVHAGVVDKHTVTAVGARPPPPPHTYTGVGQMLTGQVLTRQMLTRKMLTSPLKY